MKLIAAAITFLVLPPIAAAQSKGMPFVKSVEPMSGKVGDTIVATGENLDKDRVTEFYIGKGNARQKIEIVEQNATTFKFKLPKTESGRYRIVVLTREDPTYVEQPVVVTVE